MFFALHFTTNVSESTDPLNYSHFNQAQWIFALLLRLDALLPSNDMFILRTICRQAQNLRYEMIKTYPSAPVPKQGGQDYEMKCQKFLQQKRMQDARIGALNMIISIISGYYGQSDLEAETSV